MPDGEEGTTGTVKGYVFVPSTTMALAEGARLNVCEPIITPEEPGKRVLLEITTCWEEAGLIVYAWEPTVMTGDKAGSAGDWSFGGTNEGKGRATVLWLAMIWEGLMTIGVLLMVTVIGEAPAVGL